jgi:PAS domain S-box-containing protein
MLVIFDPENNRFSPNNFFEQVTGYTTEDMNSPDFYERLYPDPDYREKVIQDTNSYFTKYRDYVLKDKNGNDLDTSWANIEIPVGRHIGIGIDIRERKRTEKELRIAAERFQRISLSNIIGTAIVDFEGNIYFANDYFLNTIGYDQGDLKNNRISWREITPKEFLDIDNKAVQELKYKSVTYPFEKQYIKKDGSRVWVVVSGFLLPGQDTQVFSFILNITDRKHALEIAEQRRAEIEAILNSLPDGYIIYGQDGSIRQMNERAQSILGISGSKNILSFKERLQKVDYLTVDGRHFSVDQVPSSRALRGEIIRDEVMHIQQPDRNYWISVSASPIHIDGKTLGAIIEFSDITNIHNLQDQLAEERNFVNAILQISGALIAVLDRQTHFVRFNKACEQLSGYSAEEVIGKSIFDLLIIDEEKEIVSEVVKKLLAGSTLIEIEHHVLTKSGEKRFIRWRKTVLWNKSGLVEFIIMTGIDISDSKKLYEELSISNRDLESFSYSVSHDLRGPLSVVEGFVTALREDFSNQLGDEGREYLQLIDRSVIRMQQLITSILNLSSAGRQEIKQEDVNLSEMVQRYLQQLQRYEPRRKAEFIIQPDIHAFADLRLLQVALENLLRNSWKFCSKKEITRIEFGTIYDIGSQIYYIRDNGAGFDMHFAKKLFEPFGRLHGEKEYSGTGIGLSIVLRVIVRHGGKIWAEGEVGKGATFYFTLRI